MYKEYSIFNTNVQYSSAFDSTIVLYWQVFKTIIISIHSVYRGLTFVGHVGQRFAVQWH